MIPGSNLLSTALRVIGKQSFLFFAQLSRTAQPNGQYLSKFAAAVPVTGSVQPAERKLYEQFGLDFQRSLFKFYVSKDIIDVTRDVSGDQFQFKGRTYQCLSIMPWFALDGWNEVLAVDIGVAGSI